MPPGLLPEQHFFNNLLHIAWPQDVLSCHEAQQANNNSELLHYTKATNRVKTLT